MSDLQCAARFLLALPGRAEGRAEAPAVALTARGREEARRLADEVAAGRVSMICSSAAPEAVASARLMAEVLDLPCRVVDGLQELSPAEWAGLAPERADSPVPQNDPQHNQQPEAVLAAWADGRLEVARVRPVAARLRDAVEEMADLHRGENVLVFTHPGLLALAMPLWTGWAEGSVRRWRTLPPCAPVRLDVDGDGWSLVSWPESR